MDEQNILPVAVQNRWNQLVAEWMTAKRTLAAQDRWVIVRVVCLTVLMVVVGIGVVAWSGVALLNHDPSFGPAWLLFSVLGSIWVLGAGFGVLLVWGSMENKVFANRTAATRAHHWKLQAWWGSVDEALADAGRSGELERTGFNGGTCVFRSLGYATVTVLEDGVWLVDSSGHKITSTVTAR